MLVYGTYIMSLKQFKLQEVPTMVGSIVVISVLKHCVLLYLRRNLKAAQKNVQHNLIWEVMLHEFKLGIIRWKQPKTFVMQKMKMELIFIE